MVSENPNWLDYPGVPAHVRDGLCAYVREHREPGGFLTAVLRNDLLDSATRADPESLRGLPAIISWLHNEAPSNCWGSPDRVAQWLKVP